MTKESRRFYPNKGLGGLVVNGPMEVPDGSQIAQCSDPQGAMFAIHSPAKAG